MILRAAAGGVTLGIPGMATPEILIVEDEQPIRDMLSFTLSRCGFAVRQAADAARAQLELAEARPDLIVIDWMLPGMSGLELIRTLKADRHRRSTPVIMLTARNSEDDRVYGLESGADDYLTKPFSPRELAARIRAILRPRKVPLDEDRVEVNGLTLDGASQRVSFGGDLLALTPAEYRLLELLMRNPDRAYTRSQLLDAAWGSGAYVDDRTVDVNIRRLRMQLERVRCDHLVQTIRGVGYRFSARVPE